MWTGAAYAAIQFLLLCHVDGAEPKGKGLDWRFILCSQPHLWSQSVGHCKKKIIVNPIGQNVFPPQCVWALHWREGEKGTRWGGSGIWLGCHPDASLVRCFRACPIVLRLSAGVGTLWKSWMKWLGKGRSDESIMIILIIWVFVWNKNSWPPPVRCHMFFFSRCRKAQAAIRLLNKSIQRKLRCRSVWDQGGKKTNNQKK